MCRLLGLSTHTQPPIKTMILTYKMQNTSFKLMLIFLCIEEKDYFGSLLTENLSQHLKVYIQNYKFP